MEEINKMWEEINLPSCTELEISQIKINALIGTIQKISAISENNRKIAEYTIECLYAKINELNSKLEQTNEKFKHAVHALIEEKTKFDKSPPDTPENKIRDLNCVIQLKEAEIRRLNGIIEQYENESTNQDDVEDDEESDEESEDEIRE